MGKDLLLFIKLKDKKNILFTIGSFYPLQKGGPDNSVYWLTKELSKNKNLEITVLSFFEKEFSNIYSKHNFISNGINKEDSLKIIFLKYFFIRVISLSFFKFLFYDLKNYDFVVINSFLLKSNWLIALFCSFFKVPFSLSARGELERGALVTGKKYKIFFVKFIKNIFYKNLSLIISTSRTEKRYNSFFFKNTKGIIIPNYFKPTFEPSFDNLKKNHFIYLGRLHPKKNIELTINAFSNFIKKGNSFDNLYIYGNGDKKYVAKLKSMLKSNLLKSRVFFMGPIYNKKKYLLLSSFKALILVSKSENFANVVMESLYCGTDVIISDKLPWPKTNFIHKVSFHSDKIEDTIEILSKKKTFDPYSSMKFIRSNFMSSQIINNYEENILRYAK